MTPVYCLSNPERVALYGLKPREAVFAAHQDAINKRNTWEYTRDIDRTPPLRLQHGWLCGDFWARDEALPDWAFPEQKKTCHD